MRKINEQPLKMNLEILKNNYTKKKKL